MRESQALLAAAALLLALGAAPAPAQSSGPDVIVGDLPDVMNYGSTGSIAAFAVGTTSCNIGNQPLAWIAGNNRHPVIGQNLFKLKNGRFEHVGMSWLKHGFLALSQTLCGSCPVPSNGTALNPGCSDPYSASLNGTQSGLGPRSEVNATTGYYPYPYCVQPCPPAASSSINRRLQVKHFDLEPGSATVLYFVEGQYVTFDDACWGNGNNNASYRPATMTGFGVNWTLGLQGLTQRMKPGIQAWQDADPTVQIRPFDTPENNGPWTQCSSPPSPVLGRMFLGFQATDLGGGRWHYEYALQNLNSDRSAGSFHVPLPAGATVTNAGFHDVDTHSGEPYSLTDWTPTVDPTGVTWATQTYAQNYNANALRWGTLYNFRFDADVLPGFVDRVVVGLFKPGPAPGSLTVPAPMATLTGSPAGGNVGANVLMVNGSSGGAIRRVDVGVRQPVAISVSTPPGGPSPGAFVLFGKVGAATAANAYTLPMGIGTMTFPPCVFNPGDPSLFTIVDGLSVGVCPSALPAGTTPWSYTLTSGLPIGLHITMQAVITRAGGPLGLGVSNAVLLRSSATP